MIDIITSQFGFTFLLLLFATGAAGSIILRKDDALANNWSSLFAIIGSLWGILFALAVLYSSQSVFFTVDFSVFPLLSVSFTIDKLSAFFIFVISLIAVFCSVYGIGYVKHFYKKYNIGALGFFYNLFIIGMFLVVTASNGLFFLVVWEIMAVTSYFLVIYDRNNQSNIKAGSLYLVMTNVSTVFIIIAFLMLYDSIGSFNFEAIKSGAAIIPASTKNIIFVLAVIGFGTKAGIIPSHIWLPSAHPAAPSHVSGLMSAVMIKTGIYMMIRIFFDLLQPVPAWWGLSILIIGSASSLLGVLYALTEHDIKRLLAYHSIENIGIILLGLGSALTFYSFNMPSLAILGLAAALFHTLNHAVFKSLLFLSAGSVINEIHTRNMEKYGGLIKYMPQTALFFLVGSMAISALPPFNGFFSEWLTFQSLFQGTMALDSFAGWIFIASAGSLAFTGGLALMCFVKVFGVTFLARPRSKEIHHTKESSPSMRLGMGALAIASLLFGIFSGHVVSFLESIAYDLGIRHNIPSASISSHSGLTVGNFAFVSAPEFFALFIIVFIIILLITKYIVNKNQKVSIGATWDCGVDLTPRMEITATGLARSIIIIFKGILQPAVRQEVEYRSADSKHLPKSRTVTLNVPDLYRIYLYEPLQQMLVVLSERVKRVQSGNINVYILYILIALVIALIYME